MNRKTILQIVRFLSILVCCANVGYSENIDPYNDGSQYTYGENVGWLNFEPNRPEPNVGATVSSSNLTGFIWAENIGWINLDPNDADPDTGIANDGAGNLSGFAWGENVGWINFEPNVPGDPNHYGVTIDIFGNFDGWAWGENIGWINFSSVDLYGYNVKACKVNFEDLANFVNDWLKSGIGLPADLDNSNDVNFVDYSIFADYWRDYCPDGWLLKPDLLNLNLVAHWKFDELSGNTAYDSSGYGNDGTLMGDPCWVPGKAGGALLFDGSGDYVDCNNDPIFDITDKITVMAWIKVNAFDKYWQTIIAKGDDSWRLARDVNRDSLAFGCTGLSDNWVVRGNVDVNDGEWHHIAGVYDGSEIYLYVDGELDISDVASGNINISSYNVYIGENEEMSGRYWKGYIDDVRVYNRALSSEEVKALFDSY